MKQSHITQHILIFFLILNCSHIKAQTTFDTPYGSNTKVGTYVPVNGIQMYYETYGAGEPLLLIHGCGADIKSMAHQIEYFKDKYRVIVADSRGQGKSELKTDSSPIRKSLKIGKPWCITYNWTPSIYWDGAMAASLG